MIRQPSTPMQHLIRPVLTSGIRWTLMAVNAFHVVAGAVIIGLGSQVEVSTSQDSLDPPPLWWLGVLPLTIGLLGLICCSVGKKIWVILWVVYNVLSTSAGYSLLTVSGCLTPEAYGVNIHIYAECHQFGDFCICSARGGASPLTNQRALCSQVWFSTTIFLAVICTFTVCLVGFLISAILASLATCCLHYYGLQQGANLEASVISNAYAGKNYSTFATEYVPPSATRSVIVNNHVTTQL
ncbi:hypothetical protein CAPTEDRAFT_223295 [Capitella teleta]|uniref:Uncharacterized protein n=1 Tax=Capitella teleta TaxID=283909 RepID=R7V539_CAPTE|nr:hypothetical protein CAPTEDRAFT_223295 [Capitella teleta]|eukprot:ELU13978.1 hypothetical protein CAPTEDRAFT_223295 [Capitella teleta]